jgi:hypothetical protein
MPCGLPCAARVDPAPWTRPAAPRASLWAARCAGGNHRFLLEGTPPGFLPYVRFDFLAMRRFQGGRRSGRSVSVINFEVREYQLFLGRSMSATGAIGQVRSYIVCQGSEGHRLLLYFMVPGSDVPDNHYDPKEKLGTCFLPQEAYPWAVDMLRNESPVFAYCNQATPQWNRIYTGNEPVGEGELAMARVSAVKPMVVQPPRPKPMGK